MTDWTDQFSSTPIGVARPRYRAISFSSNTTLVWPDVNSSSSSYVADVNDCTPSTTGLSLTMPDATLVSTGRDALFANLGADDFTLKKSDGTSITTVTAGSKVHVYLTDNSTAAGSWRVTVFGATSAGADASALDGPGLTVISTELAAAHTVSSKSIDYTILTTDRAKLMKWTGGAGTFTFTAAATLGDNWFCLVSNQGSGVLTLDGNSSETIDGDTTKAIQQDESCIVVCDGSNLFTVGYGRAVASTLTRLSKSVAGNSDVTLTASEAANVELEFTGALTGNINVIVPVTVAQYLSYNNTTGAFTLTQKTSSGTGIDIPQGTRAHVYCDGTNVVEAMDPKRLVNAQTGTTYTVLNGDRAKLVTFTNASSIAVTLPQAGASASFTKGWFADFQNRGAGAVTITPTTSTVDGASSIILRTGNGCRIFSDGTNYFTMRGIFSVTDLTAETAPAIADEVPIYDSSASAMRKATLDNVLKIIAGLTSVSAATGDLLAINDVSDSNNPKRCTVQSIIDLVPTADTKLTVSSQTGNFTAGTTNNTIYSIVPSGSAAIATLPAATTAAGTRLGFKNNTDGKDVTIARAGSDTIDGLTSFRVPGRDTIWLVSDGTSSWIVETTPKFLVGQSIEWWTDTLPDGGWTWANGEAISRTTYAGLFAVYSTTFGTGDGSTTFNVQDTCGRAVISSDDMGGISSKNRVTAANAGFDGDTLGAAGGDERLHGHTHVVGAAVECLAGAGNSVTAAGTSTPTTGSTGGGNAQNMQPSIVGNRIVKT